MSLRRPRLGSLRNKLVLLFLTVVASAFGVIYFFVVPQLESSLEDAKLDELTRVAASSQPALEGLMGNRGATARDAGPARAGGGRLGRRAGDPVRRPALARHRRPSRRASS